MLKVYGVANSRAHRTLWMLEELGVEYEHVKTNFATRETRTPEYLAVNPNGHIPALEDGDTILWESMAINLYLAKKFAGPLSPSSLADEGHALKWSVWAMTEVEPLLVTGLRHSVMLPPEQRDPAKRAAVVSSLNAPLGVLAAALEGRDSLLGGDFSVADLNVSSVLTWAPIVGVEIARYGAVGPWFERCVGRPAFTRAQQR